MRWSLGLLLVACSEPDPLDEAWNRVFEVQTYREIDKSCETPTNDADPPRRYVGIGLGSTFDGVFNATTYWCESATSCEVLPFSNAVLTEVTEQVLRGYFVDTAFDSNRLCQVTWTSVHAQLEGSDALTLSTKRLVTQSQTQVTSEDCQDFAEGLIDNECDQSQLIEAVPAN